jgi:hypothetical protein
MATWALAVATCAIAVGGVTAANVHQQRSRERVHQQHQSFGGHPHRLDLHVQANRHQLEPGWSTRSGGPGRSGGSGRSERRLLAPRGDDHRHRQLWRPDHRIVGEPAGRQLRPHRNPLGYDIDGTNTARMFCQIGAVGFTDDTSEMFVNLAPGQNEAMTLVSSQEQPVPWTPQVTCWTDNASMGQPVVSNARLLALKVGLGHWI